MMNATLPATFTFGGKPRLSGTSLGIVRPQWLAMVVGQDNITFKTSAVKRWNKLKRKPHVSMFVLSIYSTGKLLCLSVKFDDANFPQDVWMQRAKQNGGCFLDYIVPCWMLLLDLHTC